MSPFEMTLDELCYQLAYLEEDLKGLNLTSNLVKDLKIDLTLEIVSRIPKEEILSFFWSDGTRHIFLSYEDEIEQGAKSS
jgi:hypothetical protein